MLDFKTNSLIEYISEYFAYPRDTKTRSAAKKRKKNLQLPQIYVQGTRVHPQVFRTRCKMDTMVYSATHFSSTYEVITFEIGELKSSCRGRDEGRGVGYGINYYWKNKFIKRKLIKNSPNHALFIDLDRVARPNQYKNDFQAELLITPDDANRNKSIIPFQRLEKKLKTILWHVCRCEVRIMASFMAS